MSVVSRFVPNQISSITEIRFEQTLGLLGLFILFILPAGLTEVQLYPMIGVIFLMMFAMTWDIASGHTGDLNLGHTAFIGLGGYTTALLNIDYGISPIIGIPIGAVVAGIGGLLIGIPALRLRGPYLALITLIIPVIMVQMTILFRETLRGLQGFGVPPTPMVGTLNDAFITVESSALATLLNYYLALGMLVFLLLIILKIGRSDTSEILRAIQESEDAVAAMGFNPAKYRIFAFTISAATAGLAGALFVHTPVGHPSPGEILSLELSLIVVVIAVLGGMGTIIGSLVGAFLFGTFEVLIGRTDIMLPILDKTLDDLMPIPLMVIGLAFIMIYPQGFVPLIKKKISQNADEKEIEHESDVQSGISIAKIQKVLRNIRESVKERKP